MINLGFRASTREHKPLLAAAVAGLLSLLGCADESVDVKPEDEPERLALLPIDGGKAPDAGKATPAKGHQPDAAVEAPAPDSSGLRIKAPNGAYTADVKANGTGCPLGTSEVTIAPDGGTFRIEFKSYEIALVPSKKLETRDCILQTTIITPETHQFAVSKLVYAGDVRIDDGVQMRLATRYWFQGDPSQSLNVEQKTSMDGPLKRDYLYSYTPDEEDVIWSPCGLQRNLNVYTRLQLMNERTPGRSGYANLASAIDGTQRLAFGLLWRKCEE